MAARSHSKVFRQRRSCSGRPVILKITEALSSKQNTAETAVVTPLPPPGSLPRPGGSMRAHSAATLADRLLSSVYLTADQTRGLDGKSPFGLENVWRAERRSDGDDVTAAAGTFFFFLASCLLWSLSAAIISEWNLSWIWTLAEQELNKILNRTGSLGIFYFQPRLLI